MSDTRRYSDVEVREIFSRATREERTPLPPSGDQQGLTLAELQEVGQEVGIPAERVAAAAAAVGRRDLVPPRRTTLGAPMTVGRIVELPRAATDREWEILVTELRQTFHAKGRVASHGDIREWTNGKLHAFLEPTPDGHRLRLGTLKSDARPVTAAGVAGVIVGLPLLLAPGLGIDTFGPVLEVVIPALLVLGGVGLISGNLLRLRRWAAEREGQMEYIAGRARAMLLEPPAEGSPGAGEDSEG